MSEQIWWYVARSTGYVAWGLLTASMIAGLLISTRMTKGRATPAWMLDLHRFIGGLSVVFVLLHLVGLVADSYVHFGIADLLVPYASSWKPGAVALGIVATHLLVAVEVTSLLMKRIPRRIWHAVHLVSYLVFWLSTFHMIAAGTDATNPLARIATALSIVVVVFFTIVRALSGRGTRRSATSEAIAARAA
jgi:predicted ferric reductase